jgi:hypothetical protein
MELTLNAVWTVLAAVMALLWLRFRLRTGVDCGTQCVGLIVLLLILFPVVSVSDDLVSLQNPAEVDCCARRDHAVAGATAVLPAIVASVPSAVADPPSGVLRLSARGEEPFVQVEDAALGVVANRPPPAA